MLTCPDLSPLPLWKCQLKHFEHDTRYLLPVKFRQIMGCRKEIENGVASVHLCWRIGQKNTNLVRWSWVASSRHTSSNSVQRLQRKVKMAVLVCTWQRHFRLLFCNPLPEQNLMKLDEEKPLNIIWPHLCFPGLFKIFSTLLQPKDASWPWPMSEARISVQRKTCIRDLSWTAIILHATVVRCDPWVSWPWPHIISPRI